MANLLCVLQACHKNETWIASCHFVWDTYNKKSLDDALPRFHFLALFLITQIPVTYEQRSYQGTAVHVRPEY